MYYFVIFSPTPLPPFVIDSKVKNCGMTQDFFYIWPPKHVTYQIRYERSEITVLAYVHSLLFLTSHAGKTVQL